MQLLCCGAVGEVFYFVMEYIDGVDLVGAQFIENGRSLFPEQGVGILAGLQGDEPYFQSRFQGERDEAKRRFLARLVAVQQRSGVKPYRSGLRLSTCRQRPTIRKTPFAQRRKGFRGTTLIDGKCRVTSPDIRSGPKGTRTLDLHNAIVALSQLSYGPINYPLKRLTCATR